jgi:4-aminobutyrate aminotransferase-like enzyme
MGTEGPLHNVIKIRPPMPFAVADADRVVEALDEVFTQRRKDAK